MVLLLVTVIVWSGLLAPAVNVAPGQWHTLRVNFEANHFTVMFDGKRALEWDDTTFSNAGKVGVWTKADSVTLFDDFSYGPK